MEYARAVTGNAVEYRAYQEVAGQHADVSPAEFAASIQLFTGGRRYSGARAAFETLALGGRRGWLAVYGRLPGCGVLLERLYRWVSAHRELCHRVSKILFGARLGPRTHVQTADLVYRGIAGCGLVAFASWWWQAAALVGADGILPAAQYLDAIAAGRGWERFWLVPTALWLHAGDAALHAVCGLGVVATVCGVLGRARLLAAVTAYLCYLSLFHAGQVFMAYQWDILLVECFVVAAILSRAPTLGIWVARLLLFRFMLLSGVVKLASGDPTWADGSALAYHFETQPLPTVLAWYAHQLPGSILTSGVYVTFVLELVLPFFIFLPRNVRLMAGAGFVLLELLILATGNYNFFNVLTIVLCLALLDDGPVQRLRGITGGRRRWLTVAVAGLVIAQGLVITVTTLQRDPAPRLLQATAPWLIANRYGLFAVMTTRRDELIIEGSMDGVQWRAYAFPFKPGALDRAPVWVAPHQPRLDWQMWFAALGPPDRAPWIYDFAFALLQARPAVLALLEDPFEGRPPAFLRIRRYPYRFTRAAERASSGNWWARGAAEEWLAPIRLRVPKISHEPLTLE